MLREEGLRVILVNSNPATIMTDPEFADATYVEPITPEVVETDHRSGSGPTRCSPTLGGQTALNTAIALHERGVLEKYGVELIGADVDAIRRGEDRQRFKEIVAVDRRRVRALASSATRWTTASRPPRSSATRWSSGRRSPWAAPASGIAYDEEDLRRIAGAGLQRAPPPRCSSRSRSSAGRSTSSS